MTGAAGTGTGDSRNAESKVPAPAITTETISTGGVRRTIVRAGVPYGVGDIDAEVVAEVEVAVAEEVVFMIDWSVGVDNGRGVDREVEEEEEVSAASPPLNIGAIARHRGAKSFSSLKNVQAVSTALNSSRGNLFSK